ncbi:MAG: alginate export family protein [Candidatus Omnitrophica bacterium]|nr:alginate export family protein [Candidatus Omnitrophota bacterium]
MKYKIIMAALFFCFFVSQAFAADNFLKGYQVGDWKADFGIEERFRWEYQTDFDYNQAAEDDGNLFFNRLRLNAKFSLEKSIEVFVEGLDARVANFQRKKNTQLDDLDLHQAYINLNKLFDSGVSLKLGRQELQYGKGRIVASPTWANLINAFDAAVIKYREGAWSADALLGYVVKYDDNNPNHINDEEQLNGVYLGYQKDKKSPLFEVYDLNLIDNNKKSTGHIHRYTIGARVKADLWDGAVMDVELPYQFGEYGTKDIKAYALHADLTQSFDAMFKPKLTLEFNLASGDDDANDNDSETFVPLYQSTHAPYGIMDFFRWQNMREIAASASITPAKKLQLTAGVNYFWLDSTRDIWYSSLGSTIKTATTSDVDSFVGTEVSLIGKYDLTKEIQLEAGYAHFYAGGYVKDRGAHDDADWCYAQTTIKF